MGDVGCVGDLVEWDVYYLFGEVGGELVVGFE